MIKNGQKVKDTITGFTGVVVGVVKYISGCNQALVTPPTDKDGKITESEWFDIQRLLQIGTKQISLVNTKTPGCAKQAPKR